MEAAGAGSAAVREIMEESNVGTAGALAHVLSVAVLEKGIGDRSTADQKFLHC